MQTVSNPVLSPAEREHLTNLYAHRLGGADMVERQMDAALATPNARLQHNVMTFVKAWLQQEAERVAAVRRGAKQTRAAGPRGRGEEPVRRPRAARTVRTAPPPPPGKPFSEHNLPEPVWDRAWCEDGHQGSSDTYQALYVIAAPTTPWVGVRTTIRVAHRSHEAQSYATAEVWDGTSWHAVAGLHPLLMRAGVPTAPAHNSPVRYSPEGARADIARLLEDARLAYTYRAMGPAEFAERERVVVTQAPLDFDKINANMRGLMQAGEEAQ